MLSVPLYKGNSRSTLGQRQKTGARALRSQRLPDISRSNGEGKRSSASRANVRLWDALSGFATILLLTTGFQPPYNGARIAC